MLRKYLLSIYFQVLKFKFVTLGIQEFREKTI